MIVTRDIVEFIEKNDADMRALAAARTGIHDKAILDELMSRTYASMLAHKTLSKWVPKHGRKYETYVATILFWEARKMGRERKPTVPLDSIKPPMYNPLTAACLRLTERLYDYNRYISTQLGLTGAFEIGTYVNSKIEGFADRELGGDTARIRRLHKKWVGNYQAADPS